LGFLQIIESVNQDVEQSSDSILPKFSEPMIDQVLNNGETCIYSVLVLGTPTPEVTFYKDGKLVITSALSKYEIRHDNDRHSLIIKNVDIDDNAEYACRAMNVSGEVWSFANMTVHETPGFLLFLFIFGFNP
jgi:titin